MKKAMLTFGTTPPYQAMLAVTMPGKLAYAMRHGYTIHDPSTQYRGPLPIGWWRNNIAMKLLQDYDQVLLLGADVLICDTTIDLATDVPATAWQAIALHGNEPNNDVWLLTPAMLPVLSRIATQADNPLFSQHIWQDQAALMVEMGYSPHPPYALDRSNVLWENTFILDDCWNWHFSVPYHSQQIPRFRHAAAYPEESRAALLAEWQRMYATENA
jgi:hypothetical protein